MPKPRKGETEKSYIKRCIPFLLHEGKTKDPAQASAICHSLWDSRNKKKEFGLTLMFKGSSSSGNYGHAGIPGHVGGSASGKGRGSGKSNPKKERTDYRNMTREEAQRRLDNSHGMSKAKWDKLWEISRHGKRESEIKAGLNLENYKKLSAPDRAKVLKKELKGYKENYIPKNKQTRILNKLSEKGKKQWVENNKRVGQLEGIRRAMVARGDSSSRKEQRKNYHFGLKLQEQVASVRSEMKKFKSFSGMLLI